MSKHIEILCDQHVRIINVHILLNFQIFYLIEGAKSVQLIEFLRFSKCENDVITW